MLYWKYPVCSNKSLYLNQIYAIINRMTAAERFGHVSNIQFVIVLLMLGIFFERIKKYNFLNSYAYTGMIKGCFTSKKCGILDVHISLLNDIVSIFNGKMQNNQTLCPDWLSVSGMVYKLIGMRCNVNS